MSGGAVHRLDQAIALDPVVAVGGRWSLASRNGSTEGRRETIAERVHGSLLVMVISLAGSWALELARAVVAAPSTIGVRRWTSFQAAAERPDPCWAVRVGIPARSAGPGSVLGGSRRRDGSSARPETGSRRTSTSKNPPRRRASRSPCSSASSARSTWIVVPAGSMDTVTPSKSSSMLGGHLSRRADLVGGSRHGVSIRRRAVLTRSRCAPAASGASPFAGDAMPVSRRTVEHDHLWTREPTPDPDADEWPGSGRSSRGSRSRRSRRARRTGGLVATGRGRAARRAGRPARAPVGAVHVGQRSDPGHRPLPRDGGAAGERPGRAGRRSSRGSSRSSSATSTRRGHRRGGRTRSRTGTAAGSRDNAACPGRAAGDRDPRASSMTASWPSCGRTPSRRPGWRRTGPPTRSWWPLSRARARRRRGRRGRRQREPRGADQHVKQQLVDAGFGIAERIPEVAASFTIVQSDDLATVQNLLGVLDDLSTWFPVIGSAPPRPPPSRWRGTAAGGCSCQAWPWRAACCCWVRRSTCSGRSISTHFPTSSSAAAAGAIYDQLVSFIRLALRGLRHRGADGRRGGLVQRQPASGPRPRRGLVAGIDGPTAGDHPRGPDDRQVRRGPGAVPRTDPRRSSWHRGRRLPGAGPPDGRHGVGVRPGHGPRPPVLEVLAGEPRGPGGAGRAR